MIGDPETAYDTYFNGSMAAFRIYNEPLTGGQVRQNFEAGAEDVELPRFGTTLAVPAGMDRIAYYGKGPHEAYVDRQDGARLGRFTSTVEAFNTPYIYPQEHGNRMDVRWLELTDTSGRGWRFEGRDLNVSVWPYTAEDLEAIEKARAALDAVLGGEPVAESQKASIGCNIKWRPGNEPDYF